VPGFIPERPSIILKPGVIKLDGQFHPKTSDAAMVRARARARIRRFNFVPRGGSATVDHNGGLYVSVALADCSQKFETTPSSSVAANSVKSFGGVIFPMTPDGKKGVQRSALNNNERDSLIFTAGRRAATFMTEVTFRCGGR